MSAKKILLFGILVWASYLLARSGIQKLLPSTDWPSYFKQDFYITLARLASALAMLWLATRRWSLEVLGLKSLHVGSGMAWAAVITLLVGALLGVRAQTINVETPWGWRVFELAVALIVAANEEIAFRGLFYRATRELKGRHAAVWLPTLVFTLTHYGYQPLFHLPKVFFIGATFALLRARGASLLSLILIHFVYDGFYAIALPQFPVSANWYLAAFACAAAAMLLALAARLQRPWPESTDLVFVYGTLKHGKPESKAINMEGRADYLGTASIPGKLYSMGSYPGLRASRKRGEMVSGEVYALSDPGLLKELDAYEGDEYLRDRVALDSGKEAWVYYLRRQPKGKKILKRGAW